MSDLESKLVQQIKWAGLPEPTLQFRAVPGRKFRWDLAYPEKMLLVEVQGGIWNVGAHSSGVGINRDLEKANLATLLGYRCLLVTSNHIRSGQALAWIQEALGVKK